MKRPTFAILLATLAAVLCWGLSPCIARADSDESRGYWKFYKSTITEDGFEPYVVAGAFDGVGYNRGAYTRWECTHGKYTEQFVVNEDIYHTESSDLALAAGDEVTSVATYDVPKERYRDTDKLTMNYDLSCGVVKRDVMLDLFQKLVFRPWVEYGVIHTDDGGKEQFSEKNGITYLDNEDGDSTARTDKEHPNAKGTFTCKLRSSYNDYESAMRIVVDVMHMRAEYWYRWVDEPVATKNGIEETPPAEKDQNEETGENGKIDVTIEVDAPDIVGEIGKFAIPVVIVTGAAVAAIKLRGRKKGGPSDDSGDDSDDDPDDRPSSTFRMVLWKDFGDCLRVGGEAQTVGARIEELRENLDNTVTVIERDDLTGRISISAGRYANVVPGGAQGRYKTALVDIPEGTFIDPAEKHAVVSFTFSSSAGSFRSNVSFRVVGEPRIVFPELTADGTGWNEAVWLDTVRMVAGMGGSERLRFVILDAPEEPEDITFDAPDGLEVTPEKDPELGFTYYACIENRTEPMEKESLIFAEKRDESVGVTALFADRETVSSSFTVELWPDGLSVPPREGDVKNGRLLVDTLPDALRTERSLSDEIKPTYFSLYACYVENGEAQVLENPSIRYGKTLAGELEEYGYTFEYFFDYELHAAGQYTMFCPKDTLPTAWEPYRASLAIECTSAGADPMSAKLPLELSGVVRRRPSNAEWRQAFDRLRKVIELYGLGNEPEIREVTRRPEEHSAAELEDVTNKIILYAATFERQYSKAYGRMDELFTRYMVVSSALVSAGDYAVKYIMAACWGDPKCAKAAACFVNPFKNMLFTYIGECIAAGTTEGVDSKFIETLKDSVKNVLTEALTGDLKPEPEKLGYVVAAYLMFCFCVHYWGEDDPAKGDVYKAVISAAEDLCVEKFKEFLSDAFKSLWDKVRALFGKLFETYFSVAANKAADAARNETFKSVMRDAAKTGEVTTGDLLYARSTSYDMWSGTLSTMEELARFEADTLSKGAVEAVDITLGQVLNYLAGGKLDSNEALGLKTSDVLAEFIINRFKLYAEPIHDSVTNPAGISVTVDSTGAIIVSVLGSTVRIPFMNNQQVFFDAVIEYCFGWMKAILLALIPGVNEVPDLRDRLNESVDFAEKQLEKLNDLQPITYECRKDA